MSREHEYEIRAHYDADKVIGSVWWDGKKIVSDNPQIMSALEDRTLMGLGVKDGPKFLRILPQVFSNGYMSARKVK